MASNADTEHEKKGLKKLLEIHEAPNDADSEIEEVLIKTGLEPTHWLPIFKTQLGVRTPQELQHIGSESYVDLEQFAQKPWEQKALKKILKMDDEEPGIKSLRENQEEKLQQRKDKCLKSSQFFGNKAKITMIKVLGN